MKERRMTVDKEKQILHHIRRNPFITQQELADKMGISRSAVAGYIAQLTRRGEIKGRAYVLCDEGLIACIGGANLDRKARGKQQVRLHSSNPVTIMESCGGVARNIAENLGRLGCNSSLITCIGEDKEGEWIVQETKKHGVDISQVWRLPTKRTGTYTALLDIDGEMVVSLANMDIYDSLTPEMFAEKWSHIAAADAVFLDTNRRRIVWRTSLDGAGRRTSRCSLIRSLRQKRKSCQSDWMEWKRFCPTAKKRSCWQA